MNDPERLRQAIKDLHGLESVHVCSVPFHEVFRGETVWEGDVEEFAVTGHPTAKAAYAWTYFDDVGRPHHVAVLSVPPINSAVDAVKAAVAAHIKRSTEKKNDA